MIGSIKPTRSELLRTKKRIQLAKKGHELLKRKQDSLVIEFFRLLKEIKAMHEMLQERYAAASKRMDQARALESDLRIKAAAIAVRQSAPIEVQVKNVAGVKVPQITRVEQQRDMTPYDSLMLQDVGAAYIDVLEIVFGIAAKETALRKILIEIKKTKRRAHALDHILIPELTAAKQHITFELEERAREEFSRLKRRKH